MTDKIDANEAKQLAVAAAQGVANAIKQRGGKTDEFYMPPHIVCGLPPYLYEVPLVEKNGQVTPGQPTPFK